MTCLAAFTLLIGVNYGHFGSFRPARETT